MATLAIIISALAGLGAIRYRQVAATEDRAETLNALLHEEHEGALNFLGGDESGATSYYEAHAAIQELGEEPKDSASAREEPLQSIIQRDQRLYEQYFMRPGGFFEELQEAREGFIEKNNKHMTRLLGYRNAWMTPGSAEDDEVLRTLDNIRRERILVDEFDARAADAGSQIEEFRATNDAVVAALVGLWQQELDQGIDQAISPELKLRLQTEKGVVSRITATSFPPVSPEDAALLGIEPNAETLLGSDAATATKALVKSCAEQVDDYEEAGGAPLWPRADVPEVGENVTPPETLGKIVACQQGLRVNAEAIFEWLSVHSDDIQPTFALLIDDTDAVLSDASNSVDKITGQLKLLFPIASVIVAGIAVLLIFVVSRMIVRPVLKVRDAAVRFSQGDLGTRTLVTSRDEIGQMATAFNEMADSRKRAEEEARLLLTMTQAIGETEDFHAAVEVTLRQVCEATSWEFAESWIPRPDGTALEYGPAWCRKAETLAKFTLLSEQFTFTPGSGLPGRVWSSNQTEWIKDVSTEPEQSFLRARGALEAGLKAALGVPITASGKVLAVMVFFMFESRAEDQRAAELVSAVAQQLGSVVLRKRAEEALRDSEERFRALVETSPDVIYTLSPDGTLTSLNPAFETVTGWPRDEWIGKIFAPIIHPDDRLLAVDVVQRLLREEEVPPTTELRVVTKSGGYVTGEFASTLQMREGRVLGVLGIVRDITERKRAEEALRSIVEGTSSATGDEFFRSLARNLASALDVRYALVGELAQGTQNRVGTLAVWAGEGFGENFEYDLAGTPCNNVVGQTMCCYPENVQQLFPEDHLLVEMGVDSYLGMPLFDSEGNALGLLAVLHDEPMEEVSYAKSIMTIFAARAGAELERKRAEEALRRLNEELEKEHRETEALNRSLERRVKERTQALRLTNEELQERNQQFLDARAQAATDGLTGLRNHRTFQEKVRDEVSEAQATGTSLGLIMLDIDGFKGVNDSLGHQAGDDILILLAKVLTDAVQWQYAYRYGGDEFAVLLPGSDGPKTARIAERLRRTVAKRTDGNGPKITISLGIADFPHSVDSADQLIYGADAAMYWAKSAGKNRVGDWGKMLQGRMEGSLPWYAADRGVRAPDVVAALVAALAAKDPATAAHTERCSWYTGKLAEELGLGEEEASVIRLASLLHDIGKLAVPDEVLFKPGPLNEDEWAIMKQHPTATLHVLGHIHSIADATPAILHHHEHFDGSGYPDGLAGEDIPLASRILLVTDAFDAMTTDRPYREAMPVEAAIEELERNSGSQFDPAIVEAFLRILARDGAQPLRSGTEVPEPTLAGSAGESKERR